MNKIDKKNIDSIKYISLNIFSLIQNSTCGLDTSLKLAPILYFLYKDYIKFNPLKPNWYDRDRLVFSQGYSGPLLYSALHHFGYEISKKDLMSYSQHNSLLPTIPTFGVTPGVDATTYPIGQDIAQSVGLALSQKFITKKLDKKDTPKTYVLCIGEAMHNGKTYEAMSFAGNFKLNNLIVINVQIYSKLKKYTSTFNDDLNYRCKSMRWEYHTIDLDNEDEFEKDFKEKMEKAQKSTKPVLFNINVDMVKNMDIDDLMCPISPEKFKVLENEFSNDPKMFELDKKVQESFEKIISKKIQEYKEWNKIEEKIYSKKTSYNKIINKSRLDIDLTKKFKAQIGAKHILKKHSHYCLKLSQIYQDIEFDIRKYLADSIPTYIDGTGQILNLGIMQGVNLEFDDSNTKNIVYGVRDGSIPHFVTGMALHEKMNPAFFGCTHFIDYQISGIRTAAIQKQNVLAVFDYYYESAQAASRHQELIEQLAFIRVLPNVIEWKPIDAHEAILSYNMYLKSIDHPTVIFLREEPVTTMSDVKEKDFAKGAYILKKEKTKDFKTVICSGGEMEYVFKAFKNREDIRIVSMPSVSKFRMQSNKYKKLIIPNKSNAVYIEVGNDRSMYEFADKIIGIRDDIYSQNSKSIVLSVNKLKKLV